MDTRDWQEFLLVAGALKAGIFEALADKALSANELAGRMGYNRRATEIVLEALSDTGYLLKEGDLFGLSVQTRKLFVDKASSDYAANSFLHSWSLVKRWLTIPDVLKTGKPTERKRTPEELAYFIGAMDEGSRDTAADIVKLCLEQAPEAKSVIDVGGGPGTYARLFAQHNTEVTLFDLPDVIDLIHEEFREQKFITLIGGDFTLSLPAGPFDLAFLGNICHIYGPEKNISLFKRVAQVLNPKGTIAILDFVRGYSPRAVLFAVNMLVNTESGGTWTEKEYRTWLTESGFQNFRLWDIEERAAQLILAQLG